MNTHFWPIKLSQIADIGNNGDKSRELVTDQLGDFSTDAEFFNRSDADPRVKDSYLEGHCSLSSLWLSVFWLVTVVRSILLRHVYDGLLASS